MCAPLKITLLKNVLKQEANIEIFFQVHEFLVYTKCRQKKYKIKKGQLFAPLHFLMKCLYLLVHAKRFQLRLHHLLLRIICYVVVHQLKFLQYIDL